MTEFRTLQWSGSFDGPWSAEARARYLDGGYDGLSVSAGQEWMQNDLGFLRELAGLRYLSLNVKLKNDLPAFTIPSLEELVLNTACGLALPKDEIQASVRTVVIPDRPGLDVGRRWPEIESLRVGAWKGVSLNLLEGAPKLSTLRLEGKGQSGGLAGLEACTSLKELRSVKYGIRDTSPLRDLKNLVSLDMMAARPAAPHGRIDLADLSGSELRRLWISNAPEIFHVEALLEIPTVREIRLIDCGLSDRQRRVLESMQLKHGLRLINTLCDESR